MNDMVSFYYKPTNETGTTVRTVMKDGEPWFVHNDVCEILGISNSRDASAALDEDEKAYVGLTDAIGTTRRYTIISEPGLYSLILRSRKPEAKQFKRWITHEVIPMIRKTGGAYLSDQKAEELLFNPDLIIGLAQQVKQLRQEQEEKEAENKRLTMRIVEDQPKVEFAETVSASKGSTSLTQTAKTFGLGPNKFIEFLRMTGRIYKRGEENLPRQLYVDNGVFTTSLYTCPGGKVTTQTRVTGKGQQILHDLVKEHQMRGTYPHLIGYAGGDF